MKYQVRYERNAQKALKKMDRYTAGYLLSWIEKNLVNTENPRRIGKALQGTKKGAWRYRVGNYRLIADIQDETVTILLLEVGHRKEIYRN